MQKVYVPIGCCCATSIFMNKLEKRSISFPLDWLCSYHDVHKIFDNEFKDFLKTVRHVSRYNQEYLKLPPETELEYNLDYSVRIFHREYEEKKGNVYEETIQRRINRLLKVLNDSDKEIVFIRRGHMIWHHIEVAVSPLQQIEASIGEKEDMEKLVEVLRRKYPNLKFKIHLFIDCNCRGYENSDSEHLRVVVVPKDSVKDEADFIEELKKL